MTLLTEGNIISAILRVPHMDPASLRPLATLSADHAGTGRSPLDHLPVSGDGPPEGEVIAGDVRRGEVGLAHAAMAAKQANNPKGRSSGAEAGRGTRNNHVFSDTTGKACHKIIACGSAKQRKKRRFTALFHLLTVEALEAHSSP